MALTDEDLRHVREAVREEFQSFLGNQGMEFSEHAEHHNFIRNFRCRLQVAIKAGIWTGVAVMMSGLFALLWQTITNGGM